MDYAVGGLDRETRRRVEARLRSDPAFRALVEDWQARLAPLDTETPPLAPPGEVWNRIAADIAPQRPPAPARAGIWQSLALWRGLAVAGVAAAVIAVAQVPPPVVPGAPPQLLVAALAAPDGTPLLAATFDPLRGAVVLTPATQRDDAGKSPELWVIEGNAPPRSLGVIDIKGPNAHVIEPRQLAGIRPGAVLAITIEPLGGSPSGAPTGPVVASGTLSAV
jgi:anti-sigma-K factor RskA